MDKNLSNLLRWGIENSSTAQQHNGVAATNGDSTNGTSDPSTTGIRAIEAAPTDYTSTPSVTAQQPPATRLDPAVLNALLGGPSDADLMRAAMEAIHDPDPENTLENKLIAFDNFEQLIESLDNANNLTKLGLWPALLGCLDHEEKEFRRMAAWCVGTAVQNNEKSQKGMLDEGGLPKIVALLVPEKSEARQQRQPEDVRKKALYAVSSAVRNYQPAMDVCIAELGRRGVEVGPIDAADMDAIDGMIKMLREYGA